MYSENLVSTCVHRRWKGHVQQSIGYSVTEKIQGKDQLLRHLRLTAAVVGRMDSHGGWVLNAEDLVRFSRAVDTGALSQTLCQTLLCKQVRDLMCTPLAESSGYIMGWRTNAHA